MTTLAKAYEHGKEIGYKLAMAEAELMAQREYQRGLADGRAQGMHLVETIICDAPPEERLEK